MCVYVCRYSVSVPSVHCILASQENNETNKTVLMPSFESTSKPPEAAIPPGWELGSRSRCLRWVERDACRDGLEKKKKNGAVYPDMSMNSQTAAASRLPKPTRPDLTQCNMMRKCVAPEPTLFPRGR